MPSISIPRTACIVETWRNPELDSLPFTDAQRAAWERLKKLENVVGFEATDDELNAACAVLAFGEQPL